LHALESILVPCATEIAPPAGLSATVECLWVLEGARDGGVQAETVSPDGCIEVIVHLEERFRRRGEPVAQPRGFLVGPMTGPLSLETPARVRTVGIRFRPGRAAALSGVPLTDLADRDVVLEDLSGPPARRLIERFGESRDDAQVTEAAASFISEAARPRPWPDPAVAAAVAEILRRRGLVRLDRLASHCGVAPRSLERRFLAAVGFSPKRLARIVRFQRVFRELQTGLHDWVDVAVRCGYFDQAHLIRDFREFTGQAPTAHLDGRGELARQFTSSARLERFFAAG
jgi:AraC-like DNA-binding protein